MVRIAVLSKTICPTTIATIKHFKRNNFDIQLVIVEKNIRKKYSKTEINFRKNHDLFNRKQKKYGIDRRVLRRIWDVLIPKTIKNLIELHVSAIPIVRRSSPEYMAQKLGINVNTVNKHSSQETRKLLTENAIDYVLLGSSNWLLKKEILDLENCKFINVHPGKLPDFKSLDALPWSIHYDADIGCTAFFIDETIDGGDILKFYKFTPQPEDTLVKLQKRIASHKPEIFLEMVKGLQENTITPKKQESKGMICSPMTLEQLEETEIKLQNLIKSKSNSI